MASTSSSPRSSASSMSSSKINNSPKMSQPSRPDESRQHHEDEWTAMSPHIRRLYMTERRRLKDVVHIMEWQYGFKATPRMYKIRLARWGLFKNKSRKRPNSSVKVRGDDEDENDAPYDESTPPEDFEWPQAFWTRDSSEDSDLLNLGMMAAQPMQPDYSFRQIQATAIFSTIRAWSSEQLGVDNLLYSLQGEDLMGEVGPCPSIEMYQNFALASRLFARCEGHLAGKAVRKGFMLADQASARLDTALIWNFIDVLHLLAQQGQSGLLNLFLNHMAQLPASCGMNHPLADMAQRFQSFDDNYLPTMITKAWECYQHSLQPILMVARDKMQTYLDFITVSESGSNMLDGMSKEVIETGLRQWLRDTDSLLAQPLGAQGIGGPSADLGCFTNLGYSENRLWYATIASYIACSSTLFDAVPGASPLPPPGTVATYLQNYANKAAAATGSLTRRWDLVEDNIRLSLAQKERSTGYCAIPTLRTLWSLESLLESTPRIEECKVISADLILRISEYLGHIPDEVF